MLFRSLDDFLKCRKQKDKLLSSRRRFLAKKGKKKKKKKKKKSKKRSATKRKSKSESVASREIDDSSMVVFTHEHRPTKYNATLSSEGGKGTMKSNNHSKSKRRSKLKSKDFPEIDDSSMVVFMQEHRRMKYDDASSNDRKRRRPKNPSLGVRTPLQ